MQSIDVGIRQKNWLIRLHEKLTQITLRVTNCIESSRITLQNVLVTFISCLLIRNFLESFSQRTNVLLDYSSQELMGNLAHFDAAFTALALMLTLILHYFTKVSITNVIKVVFSGFILILLSPVIDLLFSHGEGINQAYISPEENLSLLTGYFTYFGNFIGPTPGIRIEVGIAIVGVYFYTFAKTGNFLTSVITAWVAYTAIFLWGASPFIVKPIIEWFGYDYYFSGLSYLRYFLILNFFLSIWVGYLLDRNRFMAFVREIPVLRIMHYESMFLLGICIAIKVWNLPCHHLLMNNPLLIANGVLLLIAIFFALVSAMIFNNLADVEIDKISNSHRMLVNKNISVFSYQKLAWIFLGAAFVYAALIGMQGLFFVGLVMATYYLYSSWPLRLKRIPVFSKVVISANSIALMLLGFWLVTGNISSFPRLFYWVILTLFTLAVNFIDLKDIEGDKAARIKTLPVLIGKQYTQWFCALAFFLAYLSLCYVFQAKELLIFFILAGLLQTWFLTRRNYSEVPVFLTHLASVFFLMGYLTGFLS